jgi:hypothetical protein
MVLVEAGLLIGIFVLERFRIFQGNLSDQSQSAEKEQRFQFCRLKMCSGSFAPC